MKALAVIFSSLFLVSLVGIIISAGITGVSVLNIIDTGSFHIGWNNAGWDGYEVSKEFNEAYDNIEIAVLAARTNITVSPNNVTRVYYSGNRNFRNVEFIAEVRNSTLVVREKGNFSLGWGWGYWGWRGIGSTALDIELPESVYNKIDLNLTSGKINGELPETDNLHVNITSGSVMLDYNHDNTPNHLRSHSTSGSITINGFSPKTYDIYLTSGNQRITGLSGSGSVQLTSGSANVDFGEWNGSLSIKVTSGSANVTVPAGSGADINFSRTSGSIRYSLDGDSGRLERSGNASAGGENRQRVNVDLTSGSASITN
ncbi:MAG: DUF4097 domain-containing protein [Oscillospiraceae bacterium]|nr:DUF4097 domain-containing protein [Oscillospiraceae bacterium]